MKITLFVVLMFLAFSLSAAEIKVMDIGSKDLFTYDRIEPELIFDHTTLEAGVNVKLSSGFLSEYLPRDNSVLLSQLTFDSETGNIVLNHQNKTFFCGYVKKKENGTFSRSVNMTSACKFEQRYEEQITRANDIVTRVQVLEIYLTF